MEGLWVKLGQYMSTRADVLPTAYIRLLKQLQDSLPPRPLEEVFLQMSLYILVNVIEEKISFRKQFTLCSFNKKIHAYFLTIINDFF